MANADPLRIVARVYALLGDPGQQTLHVSVVQAARIAAGMDILRAVASNPQNGYFGSLATLVTVAHNAFLPAHDGEPGIPVITLFTAGPVVDGLPATPDEIDAYRMAPTGGKLIYSGGSDGVAVLHSAADANGMPSPVAGRYSIVNKRLKFTGLSAQVPLIQLTRTMADTGVPENYEPTIVRLVLSVLPSGERWAKEAREDLEAIRDGAMQVSPIPDVETAQKAGAA